MNSYAYVQDVLESHHADGMTIGDVLQLDNDEEGRRILQTACAQYTITTLLLTIIGQH